MPARDTGGRAVIIGPDHKMAESFFRYMAPGEEITFVAFSERARTDRLVVVLHGRLDDVWPRLVRLNRAGAGIFWMVNAGDGRGCRAENVVRVRSLFVDLDGPPIGTVRGRRPVPDVLVESSPKRYHVYYRVRDASIADFEHAQLALAEAFNGNQAVKDPSRVMRVPGFFNMKGEPWRCRLLAFPKC